MDKKDIYEHLANIYLDASLKKRKRAKESHKFKAPFFVSLALICCLSLIILAAIYRKPPAPSETALVLYPDIVKINFNFYPAKKEIYSINLNKLNLSRYRALAFSLKKNNYYDRISLRVEFANVFNEKPHVYLKDIPHKWKDYKIDFSDFKGINDWSEMSNLSFIVEEWNVKEKKDIIYIDNIRVLF